MLNGKYELAAPCSGVVSGSVVSVERGQRTGRSKKPRRLTLSDGSCSCALRALGAGNSNENTCTLAAVQPII